MASSNLTNSFKIGLSLNYHLVLLILILANCLLNAYGADGINPYKILGVPRNADDKAIRNAYRKLAKDWHPDKNNAPNAHDKFLQITQAYEILSDPERRSLYDDYGTTSEPRHGGGGGYHRESYDSFFRDFDGFESFFGGGGGFRFNFNNERQQQRKSREEEINKKIYDESIYPNSNVKPFIIYSYTDFCLSCMAFEGNWQQFKQEIKNIGFGVGHSDAQWNRELSRNLGINTVPSIVGIVNGRIYHFRGDLSIKNLREFVRKLIPSKITKEVNIQNLNETIYKSIGDNKVFALFLHSSSQLTLRFQMPCYQMVHSIQCASLKLNAVNDNFASYLKKHFNVEIDKDSLLNGIKQEILVLFKENMVLATAATAQQFTYKPAYLINMNEFSYASIHQTFETYKHLHLPRLSSLQHFVDLCPSWSTDFNQISKKLFCIVFISNSEAKKPSYVFDHNTRVKLIKRINSDDYFSKSAQFVYIYADVQTDFVEKLAKGSKTKSTTSENAMKSIENKIAILKRLDDKYLQFDWIDVPSSMKNDLDILDEIKTSIKKYSDARLQFRITIPIFYEETSQSFVSLFLDYIENIYNYFTDIYFWEKLLGNSSYMMILVCTILFIWLMMMFSADKTNPVSASANTRNRYSNSYQQSQSRTTTKNAQHRTYYNNNTESHHSSSSSSSSTSSTSSSYHENDYHNADELNKSANASNFSFSKQYNINTSNKFELVEMNKKTYQDLVINLPKGFRTILLIVNRENKDHLVRLFTKVCEKYANKSYQLRFGYLHLNTIGGQKWFNELMFDKYKELTDNENDDKKSSSSSTSSSLSDLDKDYEKIDSNESTSAGGKKLNSDNANVTTVLAINTAKNYFITFNYNFSRSSSYLNLKKKNNLAEECLLGDDAEEDSENSDEELQHQEFALEFSNWLDRFTEGMCDNKKLIKTWPMLN